MAERHDQRDGDPHDWPQEYEGSGRLRRNNLRAMRRYGVRRACLAFSAIAASLLCLALLGGAIGYVRLLQGPIVFDLAPQIVAALNQRVGHGYAFDVGSTSVEATPLGPALTLNHLSLNDAAHNPVITSQKAAISLDPMSLLVGRITPKQLDIKDVELRLLILASGEVAVSTGSGTAAIPLSKAFSADISQQGGTTPARIEVDAVPTSTVPTAERHTPTNAALRALAATMRSLVDATTAPDSAFSALDAVNVTGRLVLDDRSHGIVTPFNDMEISFIKAPDGSSVLNVAADGSTGRWTLAAKANRSDDDVKTLTVEVRNLSLDVITLAGGLRNIGFDFDMPIGATASVRIAPDGSIDQATGTFKLGAGFFKLDDPDHEPLLVDSITGGFHLDPARRALAIDSTQLKAGGSLFTMTGRIELPSPNDESWKIATDASGIFGTERPGEKPVKISHAAMAFHLWPSQRRLSIDRVTVDGPEVAFESFGEVRIRDDGATLSNTSTVKTMPAKTLARLWPSFIAAPVRAWFLANLNGGTVVSGKSVVNLTDKDLILMRAQRSVPDDHVRVDYTVADLSLNVLPGLPPLTGIAGSGFVTGNTSKFSVAHGEMEVSSGKRLTLAAGTFDTPDTDPKPTPALIEAHVTGNLDAISELLSRDALKAYAEVPIDNANYRGQVDANLNIALLLGDHVPPENTKVGVTASVTNFTADKLIGKEGLTDATMQLVVDKAGIRAKGDGRMYGAPATIELKKPAGSVVGEAALSLALDDTARSKAGMTFGKSVAGLITAHVTAQLVAGERRQGTVDLDFTKCAIDGVIPGFSKAAGKPGKATLSVTQHEGGGASLDNIVFDGGGIALRGAAELDASGSLTSAKMSQVRLSPGDDMKVEAKPTADGLKLVIRAVSVDARPFLKWLTSSDGGDRKANGGDKTKSMDVDFHANVLTGQNKRALTNVDLRFQRRGAQLRLLQMSGRFGRAPLSITTVQQGESPIVAIRSADAGEALAFMDLYKRMLGGRLEANIVFGDDKLDGSATIHDFTLREDPAIKQLATEGFSPQNRASDASRIDPAAVSFTKLAANFTKVGETVIVRDGTFFGPAVGATVTGSMDFARDQINLEGTFVPLYGVNNLFSQIPLFGPILGGGLHEGLFGLNYRITGSASSPVLSVNPLSALAPGFLRKIFGAFDNTAQSGSDPRDRASGPVRSQSMPSEPALPTVQDFLPFAQ